MLGLQNEREWAAFCAKVLQKPALAADPRYANNSKRSAARDELRALIIAEFATLSADDVVRRLDDAQIANAQVNDMKAVWDHPQLRARRRWLEVDSPAGQDPGFAPARRRWRTRCTPPARCLRWGRTPMPFSPISVTRRKRSRNFAPRERYDTLSIPDLPMSLPTSYLFVPGDRPDRFAKALAAGAGAVILDLEDAVSPEAKPAAREHIRAWSASQATRNAHVIVRINDTATSWFEADLELVRTCAMRAVMLPKAECTADIARCMAALPDGGFVIPIIETARGVLDVEDVAAAPGVQRLAFGTLDYAVDVRFVG